MSAGRAEEWQRTGHQLHQVLGDKRAWHVLHGVADEEFLETVDSEGRDEDPFARTDSAPASPDRFTQSLDRLPTTTETVVERGELWPPFERLEQSDTHRVLSHRDISRQRT